MKFRNPLEKTFVLTDTSCIAIYSLWRSYIKFPSKAVLHKDRYLNLLYIFYEYICMLHKSYLIPQIYFLKLHNKFMNSTAGTFVKSHVYWIIIQILVCNNWHVFCIVCMSKYILLKLVNSHYFNLYTDGNIFRSIESMWFSKIIVKQQKIWKYGID